MPSPTPSRAGREVPFDGAEPRTGPPDALVLDIGGDIGALIIYADERCLGAEVDITPAGTPQSHDLHTMVRRRRATGHDVIAGLYPEVLQGTYTVWGLGHSGPVGEVTVRGGHVSEFQGGDCLGHLPAHHHQAAGPHALHKHHTHQKEEQKCSEISSAQTL